MSVTTPRFGTWKSCRDCPTLVLSSSNRSRCEPCKAARRKRYRQVTRVAQECPMAIERTFQQALAVIKARAR